MRIEAGMSTRLFPWAAQEPHLGGILFAEEKLQLVLPRERDRPVRHRTVKRERVLPRSPQADGQNENQLAPHAADARLDSGGVIHRVAEAVPGPDDLTLNVDVKVDGRWSVRLGRLGATGNRQDGRDQGAQHETGDDQPQKARDWQAHCRGCLSS
jgi:hypothetical protein